MESVSRRRLLAASGGAVLASGLIAHGVSAQADKPRRSPWDLTFDVSMEMPAGGMPTTPGPFYFTGNVMDGGALTPVGAAPVAPPPPPVAAPAPPAGAAPGGAPVPPPAAAPVAAAPVATGKSVGRLHVWGYAFDPARQGPSGSVAQATLELTGRGQILLGGTLVAGRVAILAGTGEFRGANGQAEYVDLGNGGARVILDYTTPYEGT